MKSPALHPIVYLKYGEKSKGGSIANLFLIMSFPVDLSTIAVIYSLFKQLLLLPGVLGSCVGTLLINTLMTEHSFLFGGMGGGAGRAR